MIEKKIVQEYNSAIKEYGKNDRRSILWTKDKQDMRFQLLLPNKLKSSQKSLLDYGCGFADLKLFLIKHFYNLEYSGCDINQNFIENCCEQYPDNDIYLINSSRNISNSYDIITVSGTFNVLGIDDIDLMYKYVFEQILILFEKTNYMLSINFLSHLTDKEYQYKQHFYLDPVRLYNFAINNMTKRIEMDSSSLPYEITFRFYKNENINYDMTTYQIV